MQINIKTSLKITDIDEISFWGREIQVTNHPKTTCLETELKAIAPSIRKDIDKVEPA